MTIRTIINDNPAEYDFDGIKKCMMEIYLIKMYGSIYIMI